MENKTKLEIEQEKMLELVKEGEAFYKSGIKSNNCPYNVIQTMKNKGKQFTKPKSKRKKSKKTFGKRK